VSVREQSRCGVVTTQTSNSRVFLYYAYKKIDVEILSTVQGSHTSLLCFCHLMYTYITVYQHLYIHCAVSTCHLYTHCGCSASHLYFAVFHLIYTCEWLHTCTQPQAQTQIHAHTYTHTHTCMNKYTLIHAHKHVHAQTQTHTHTHAHECAHRRTHIAGGTK